MFSTAFIHFSSHTSFILSFFSLSNFPSDLQLSFLFFPAWITFPSTTASTTGLLNWCWQLEFKLQPRHLTEQSSRSVSAGKCNRQPKQFHLLMRSHSWNTKHYSTVALVCSAFKTAPQMNRIRREHSLRSGSTSVQDRGDVLACQGQKYVQPCLCSVWSSCTKWFMVRLTYLRLNTPVGWLSFHEWRWSSHTNLCYCQHAGWLSSALFHLQQEHSPRQYPCNNYFLLRQWQRGVDWTR